MSNTKFLEDIDPKSFSAPAMTSCEGALSTANELEAIRKACRELSEQMPNHRVRHDGGKFVIKKRKDDSCQTVTDIYFNAELFSK